MSGSVWSVKTQCLANQACLFGEPWKLAWVCRRHVPFGVCVRRARRPSLQNSRRSAQSSQSRRPNQAALLRQPFRPPDLVEACLLEQVPLHCCKVSPLEHSLVTSSRLLWSGLALCARRGLAWLDWRSFRFVRVWRGVQNFRSPGFRVGASVLGYGVLGQRRANTATPIKRPYFDNVFKPLDLEEAAVLELPYCRRCSGALMVRCGVKRPATPIRRPYFDSLFRPPCFSGRSGLRLVVSGQ